MLTASWCQRIYWLASDAAASRLLYPRLMRQLLLIKWPASHQVALGIDCTGTAVTTTPVLDAPLA